MNNYILPPTQHFIVWDKKQPDGVTFAQAELAWTSFNGTSKIYSLSSNGQPDRIHPTQKPVALYKWLLTNYAKPGDLILDTHVGSASSLIACHDLGFSAVEAKHTENDRILFSRVEPHQAEYMDDFCKDPGAIGIVLVSFKLQRFYAVPWQFWKAARDAWESGNGKTPRPVEAYGWSWYTPGMASASAEQLLPDWEIKTGGTSGLPYLDIIERMKGEDHEHRDHRQSK